jgi:hypothetical protein
MPDNIGGVERAKGDPSKSLFIYMLTRDISLADCIVDLLDNSVDGTKEFRRRTGKQIPDQNEYKSFSVRIEFSADRFSIVDNCGGIPVDVAKEYAFRFGRSDDTDDEIADSHMIGLYGIGMKRAMFKIGKNIQVVSSTGTDSFRMALNVDEWRLQRDPDDPTRDMWDFPLTEVVRNNTKVPVGTSIEISHLFKNIAREFSTPGFVNGLVHALRRQYAFIVHSGLKLSINKHPVAAIMPSFKVGEQLAPMRVTDDILGVKTEITAGMAAPPPEDDSAESIYPDAETYGWYVVCNDRVVVTADKTALTGWGVSPLPAWHPQYYGFLGVVRFDAADPRLLPWTTTKRNVDASSEVYRRALAIMTECAKEFVDYTNKRKGEIFRVKAIELDSPAKSIADIRPQPRMILPRLTKKKTKRIQYDKPLSEIEAVAKALRMRKLSLKEVGTRTFDYYRDREVTE